MTVGLASGLTPEAEAIPTGIEGAAEPPPFPENSARFAIGSERVPLERARTEGTSRPLVSVPLPPAPQKAEPSDAELEGGILDAVRMGLADVARSLSARLEGRQRAGLANVVPLDARRREGR